MRLPIAMDQGADVMIFGDEDAPLCGGFGEQCLVAGIRCTLAGIGDIVAGIPHGAHCLRHNVRICENAHAIRRRP